MGAFDDDIVMFGRRDGRACRVAHGWKWGGVHIAVAPVPHRGLWMAECGISLPASDKSACVVHGAVVVDEGPARVYWLPPGAYMEDACYMCIRRAGATRVIGMWREAPPPRVRQRMAPRAGARKRRRTSA